MERKSKIMQADKRKKCACTEKLSTEEMLNELKNIPAEQLIAALKMYLENDAVSQKKLH